MITVRKLRSIESDPIDSYAIPGNHTDLVVNADGSIARITDERGNPTAYGYDAMGRLSLIDPPGSWTNTTIAFTPKAGSGVCTGYVTAAGWCQVITRGDHREVRLFDGLLRPLLTVNEDIGGQTIEVKRTFDSAGRALFVSYPGDNGPGTFGIQTDYDALGRARVIDPTDDAPVYKTQIEYLAGNQQQVTDPRSHTTVTTYQAFGAPDYTVPTKIIAAKGTTEQSTTSITRDVLGRMLTATQSGAYNGQPVSAARSYVYDSRGQLCKRVDPETGQSVFRFDNAGNLRWSATNVAGSPTACEPGVSDTGYGSIPASQVVVNTYDARNRLLAVDYPSGTADICYGYDATGNVTRTATLGEYGATCPTTGTLTRWDYVWNSLNLLTSETLNVDAQSFALAYGYNSDSNMNQITYPTGRVFGLAPDGLGRPTSVGGLATDISYYPNGWLASYVNGNGLENDITLNDRQVPEYIKVAPSAGASLMKWHYTYDAALNTSNIYDEALLMTIAGNLQYDGLNRLTSATGTWGTASFAYDPLGNLRQQSINGGTLTYTYNSGSNRLTTIIGSVSRSYSYDPLGNVTADGVHGFDYDLANRLTTVTGIASYAYDGHGKRVKHTATGSGEVSYSAYSLAGKRLHQYNATTTTPEDFVYLGNRILAKLVGPPVTPGTSNITFTGGTQDGNYTVTWTAATDADSYALFERKIGDVWQPVFQGKTRSYPVSGHTGGGYQYQLQACSYDDCGAWTTSGIASVTPAIPASISAPTGTTPDNTYTVSWPASIGATHYPLLEQANGGSWSTVQDTASRSKAFNKPDGSYRYAVRACNAYADCSGYRYSSTFTVQLPPATPVLSAPASSNSSGVYTVSWTAETGASRYELQERVGYTGSWAEIYDGTATSKVMLKGADGSYAYRVRACKSVACSGWSNIKDVMVTNGGGCLSGQTTQVTPQPLTTESEAQAMAPAAPCLQSQATEGGQ